MLTPERHDYHSFFHSKVRIYYGLEGLGLEFRQWQEVFFPSPKPSRPALEPTMPAIRWLPGLFPGRLRISGVTPQFPPLWLHGVDRDGFTYLPPFHRVVSVRTASDNRVIGE